MPAAHLRSARQQQLRDDAKSISAVQARERKAFQARVPRVPWVTRKATRRSPSLVRRAPGSSSPWAVFTGSSRHAPARPQQRLRACPGLHSPDTHPNLLFAEPRDRQWTRRCHSSCVLSGNSGCASRLHLDVPAPNAAVLLACLSNHSIQADELSHGCAVQST